MKNKYSLRHLMTFLVFFYCSFISLTAQTMPAPQALPYSQNFDGLAASSTTYPLGFQGWTASTSPNSSFNVSGTLVANRDLTAGSTAATTSGNFHNYNGKIGFLNTGSLDLTIGFAFDATNQTAIQVQYDAMTIRNPYGLVSGSTTSERVNELVLQYRIGTTAAFTSLPETAYVNNNVQQTGAVTLPQNVQNIKITLPAECNNQPVVQIRWISRQVSGGGSRPSFAIDNIIVGSDVTAPVTVTGYPKADNILSESFDFVNKLNEAGKTYFVLVPGGSAEPTITQIKSGQAADGTTALQSGVLDIANASQEFTKTFAGLTLNTAYYVFSVSEDLYGNVQTTVSKVDASTSSVAIPSLSTSAASLDLGFSESNYDSDILSYQIQGSNLSSDVVVTSSANFTVSKDNITFASSLVFVAADFASNASQTVYVKFTPDNVASFSGAISHESTGAAAKTVELSGIGINPYVQGFNDVNVLSNSGWTQYNVSGPINKWTSTTVARNVNSGTGAVLMNGYSDNGPSKDWLISPKLRLNNFDALALLSFYSRKFYAGPSLKLVVSTDYDGKSNPETAVWVELNGKFPTLTGSYVQSQYIDLSGFKTDHTYVAFVYETTAGGTNNASEWSFDDFAITNETGYVDANPVLNFGDVSPNAFSESQSFILKAEGYGDITLTAPASYQLSLDNISFQSSVVVEATEVANNKTVFVRFAPTTKQLTISGSIHVTGTSLSKEIGALTGSSLPKADTFDVVTYNLSFFGTDVIGSDGKEFGPVDDALQIENVAKVMNKLDADVYALQEVSDDPSIDILIQKISINGKTFDKKISTSWSYSFNAPQADFPPQKLVVLYNTQTTSVKKTRVMFKEFYDEVRNGTKTLENYPGGTGSSFFSSGRLPYLVTLETNIAGVKKEIQLIDIHARANSGSDMGRYNMRKYDTQVLKDSLDAHYANANLIILGDYNDDVKASVIAGQPSSYENFVTDTDNYNALTLGISQAGAYSFLSSGGFLDHIMISNELEDEYIQNSTAVYDPRNDIASYTTTTSDHGPVIARFELTADVLSTPDFGTKNGFFVKAYPNPALDVLNFDVKTNDTKKLKLRLYDISGRVLGNPLEITSSQEVSNTVIGVRDLAPGLYIYTLSENNKVVYKDKILKK
ncbi:T9SS-dependent choice-of-anchor J family protein [Flavobacterium gelatinilyticum]|uniref:T9SS-dependent choice-of-anchor J family protein n=1 Tax=Flavobacterium gelatinilyticum TaxID=3003260 RepID=UPI00248178A9|nr:choice-of-anchor J domain-containing protein [Flavobacterium gelatinilyticum]